MTAITVRRFREGEAPTVRALNERALRSVGDYAEDAPEPDLADIVGHYLEGDGEFLVARQGDRIVGTIAYEPVDEWILADEVDAPDDAAVLTRMRVAPERQGEGVGRALFEQLVARARAAGYERFVLDVSVDNKTARGFYEHLGFERRQTAAVSGVGQTWELAVYERSLNDG